MYAPCSCMASHAPGKRLEPMHGSGQNGYACLACRRHSCLEDKRRHCHDEISIQCTANDLQVGAHINVSCLRTELPCTGKAKCTPAALPAAHCSDATHHMPNAADCAHCRCNPANVHFLLLTVIIDNQPLACAAGTRWSNLRQVGRSPTMQHHNCILQHTHCTSWRIPTTLASQTSATSSR